MIHIPTIYISKTLFLQNTQSLPAQFYLTERAKYLTRIVDAEN